MSGRLEEIESLMPSRPDSALTAIRAIDTTRLRGASQKARYSLLLSMALAKNDIDTSDVSISAPAVEFYSRHGSRHDRTPASYICKTFRLKKRIASERTYYVEN